MIIEEEIPGKIVEFIRNYNMSPNVIFLSEKYANQLIGELHARFGREFETTGPAEFNGMKFIITTKDMVEVGVI
jgi:hypothetical protein